MGYAVKLARYVSPVIGLLISSVTGSHLVGETGTRAEPFPVPLAKQHEIFRSTNKTPNNIEYVGCGYDMYSGSGIDERTGFSLINYRAPVLDTYRFGNNEGDKQLVDLGIWVSNEFLCDLSHELTSITTRQQLKLIISGYFKDGYSNAFSSSSTEITEKDDILNKLRRARAVIIRKYRCTVYSAGLILSDSRRNAKQFDNIVKRLVEMCKNGFKAEDCPLEKYKRNMDSEGCDGCIGLWMRFFADFGTHATVRVTMGGVFRRFSNASAKEASRGSSKIKTTTVQQTSWFGLSSWGSADTKKNESKTSRDGQEDDIVQYTVGPEPDTETMSPDAFEEWVLKVAYNPVPIDVEFVSLYEMMPSEEAKRLYKDALKYYAKLKGVVYSDQNLMTNAFRSSILHLLKESSIVAVNGPGKVNKDICQGNAKIIFGFGVNLNDKRQILEVKPCYPGLNACILDLNKDVSSSFVLALCGEMNSYDVIQKMTKGSSEKNAYNEVSCPKDTVVGFGAIIQFNNPMLVRQCPTGAYGCGYPNLGPNGLIWITCFPKNTFGLNLYSTKAAVLQPDKTMTCDPGYMVVNGFLISSNNENENVVVEACKQFELTCRAPSERGASVGTYIFCAHR